MKIPKKKNGVPRSNARTLDWNGNEYIAGNLTVGGKIIKEPILLCEISSGLTANTTYEFNDDIDLYNELAFIGGRDATTGGICDVKIIPVNIFKKFTTSNKVFQGVNSTTAGTTYSANFYYNDNTHFICSNAANINYLQIYGI